MGRFGRIAAVAAVLGMGLASLAQAETLGKPTGEVLLTVSGMISVTNGDGVAELDRELLDALPQHSFATSTIWTEGVTEYQGVLLSDLLVALGASGQTIKATAINDYQIEIPVAELAADGPLLAYLADGEPMSVREKGPIWVIYPYDAVPAYRSEQTYARSIWQLTRLAIEE